jgi:L-iditol 2-dehydrogenase
MVLPDICQAAVLRKYNQPVQIEKVQIPKEIEPGAILVKIECATICGTDVHHWTGAISSSFDIPLPVVMGHEMVGRVVKFGEGVRNDSAGQPLSVNDRIIWTHASCGECFQCQVNFKESLCTQRKIYMFRNAETFPFLTGGFAQYCYVFPTSGRVKVPENIKDEWASAASCALRTVMHAFERLGALKHIDNLLIQGDGPLGLFATAVAKTKGVQKILLVGGSQIRLDLGKSWGADHTISITEMPDHKQRAEMVKDLTSGRGADIVFEYSGAKNAFAEGLDLIAPGGRYVIVGQLGGHTTEIRPTIITRKNLDIMGTNSAVVRHYYQAIEFLKKYQNDFNFDRMITGRYKLNEINEALKNMQEFKEIKAVLDIK